MIHQESDAVACAVAAALEAAAAHIEEEFGTVLSANAIRALITPDQHDALAAHVAAEVAKARAEDAAKIDKATSTLKAVEWHLRQKDHSGHIHGVVVAALAQIGGA